jgi:phosphoribosylformylglycinamidine synthase subunit PurQ / glutaminase
MSFARRRWGVAVFPGSNCDHDTLDVLNRLLGQDARFVWHHETRLEELDALILPGGFAHGDYLRTGAIARFSPIMEAVTRFAETGKPVVGICNGFQVLLEAGLLPGAMLRNRSQRFVCRWVHLRVENPGSALLNRCERGAVLRIPVAHGEGNYYADSAVLTRMNERGQVLLRYCDADGAISEPANPNGSLENIAAVAGERGNVIGLMPHPERAAESILGSEDGRALFESLLATLN